MEFVIDRSKWRCGSSHKNKRGKGVTALLNKEGFMCCLGQTCNQLGVEKEDMLIFGDPAEVVEQKYYHLPKIFWNCDNSDNTFVNSKLSSDAIDINDNPFINEKERESKLRELFKKHGHKIKFVGKSVK